MDRDPALEVISSEYRAHACRLGPIQPTDVDFPQTTASNGRRYRFQVSVTICDVYKLMPAIFQP